ncbi:glycoside hydrolase family 3 protein [Breznakiella homolactica]|uniref:beta-N-acetylhexosaminidase n=1 Tax=Breznakiella homolactica TaxID=2798577 RepID=A0A7T7XKA0_9SPIR|nr:glycoside hydrolase family 3 N-terminal domain-containing protein [Breznakiella homolactica]QQO07738.1 glycosyl hydrolase [Breznakiella homolactica]
MDFAVDLRAEPYSLDDSRIQWVTDTLESMTVREKAGQLFCLNIVDEDAGPLLRRLEELDIVPGSCMTRAMPAEKVRENFERLQNAFTVPLLLAGNIERGADGVADEGTCMGTQMQIAASGDPAMAYKAGYYSALEGAALGMNWNFGPILDIDTNWHNPITNTRVFSSDPETVLAMAREYVRGMREAGMLVCLKHWPGDGLDERDQHMVSSTNSLSAEGWMERYGTIYRTLIADGAETVMSAHIKLPAWSRLLRPGIADKDIMPGSLAAELNWDLLRGKLGFNGLVVSDATTMNGFMQAAGRSRAVPSCVAAGCDVFLFVCNLEEDFGFMMEGIRNGIITPERLDDAVLRILGMKAALSLPEKKGEGRLVPAKEKLRTIGSPEIITAARECAERAVTLVKDTQKLLPLIPEKNRRILFHVLGDIGGYHDATKNHGDYFKRKLEDEGFSVTPFDGKQADMQYLAASLASLRERFDLILYFANIKTSGSDTVARISWQGPGALNSPRYIHDIPTLFVSVDNPYHLFDVPAVKTFINGYTPSPYVMDAVIEKILGRSDFTGVSPVDPSCGLWDALL